MLLKSQTNFNIWNESQILDNHLNIFSLVNLFLSENIINFEKNSNIIQIKK